MFVFETAHSSIFVTYHYEVCGQLNFRIIILQVYLNTEKSKRIKQPTIQKKKGWNPKMAQCPFKNLDADMQYRSIAESVNKFTIRRENVATQCNNKDKKENLPVAFKRKKSEHFIPQQGKSEFVGHK